MSLRDSDAATAPFDFGWRETLGLQRTAAPTPPAFGDARCWRIEFSARGDRATGRLLTPPSDGPHPVVLLQHGNSGSSEAEYLDCAARWIQGGLAVVNLDLPLHGRRASAKMSARLAKGIAKATMATALDATEAALWTEFARQIVADLRSAVDALETCQDIDTERLAFAGFSLGAITGAAFCAVDPRPRTAVLALAGGGFGPAEVDPSAWIARIAPRPVVMINAEDDATISRAATLHLFEAAAEPKRLEWFPGGHRSLPGVALACMIDAIRAGIDS